MAVNDIRMFPTGDPAGVFGSRKTTRGQGTGTAHLGIWAVDQIAIVPDGPCLAGPDQLLARRTSITVRDLVIVEILRSETTINSLQAGLIILSLPV